MKIEYYDYCTSSGVEVDGADFYELSYDKQKEILHKVIDKVSEDVLKETLIIACMQMGECTDMGQCEECGDYNYKYKLDIN